MSKGDYCNTAEFEESPVASTEFNTGSLQNEALSALNDLSRIFSNKGNSDDNLPQIELTFADTAPSRSSRARSGSPSTSDATTAAPVAEGPNVDDGTSTKAGDLLYKPWSDDICEQFRKFLSTRSNLVEYPAGEKLSVIYQNDSNGELEMVKNKNLNTETLFLHPGSLSQTVLKDRDGNPIARVDSYASVADAQKAANIGPDQPVPPLGRIVLSDGRSIDFEDHPALSNAIRNYMVSRDGLADIIKNQKVGQVNLTESPENGRDKSEARHDITRETDKLWKAIISSELPPAAKLALYGHFLADAEARVVNYAPNSVADNFNFATAARLSFDEITNTVRQVGDAINSNVGEVRRTNEEVSEEVGSGLEGLQKIRFPRK